MSDDIDIPGPDAADKFYHHFDRCNGCGYGILRNQLCEIGTELLFEAADDLSEHWQGVARAINERKRLEREAEENFKYYEGSEEF